MEKHSSWALILKVKKPFFVSFKSSASWKCTWCYLYNTASRGKLLRQYLMWMHLMDVARRRSNAMSNNCDVVTWKVMSICFPWISVKLYKYCSLGFCMSSSAETVCFKKLCVCWFWVCFFFFMNSYLVCVTDTKSQNHLGENFVYA